MTGFVVLCLVYWQAYLSMEQTNDEHSDFIAYIDRKKYNSHTSINYCIIQYITGNKTHNMNYIY
jgi:hypothetical protein